MKGEICPPIFRITEPEIAGVPLLKFRSTRNQVQFAQEAAFRDV